MVHYTDSVTNIRAEMLGRFFDGWPSRPGSESYLRMLENREFVLLAIDSDMGTVVGFVNAVSDSVLWACIPLLEVLPQYRSMGIGKELLTRLLAKLGGFYMIDLVCDKALESFYGECGMVPASEHHCAAMMLRNYECQSGRREGKSEPDRMR